MRNPRILTATVLALLASGGLAGCGSSVIDLKVGDCLDLPEDSTGQVSSVRTTQCDSEHGAEVFHTLDIQGEAYPADLDDQATNGCLAAFEPYVGVPYAESALDIRTLAPTQDSWDKQDDRTVACLVGTSDGSSLTVSVKGSGL